MQRAKDNPQLKGRALADGRISLYLEYYVSREETPVRDEEGEPVRYKTGAMKGKPRYKVVHHRKQETLNLYYKARPRSPVEKWEKVETLKLAEHIQWERAQDFLQDRKGYRLWRDKQAVNFLDYFQRYIDAYTKKDKRVLAGALQRFKDFLAGTPEYNAYATNLKPHLINKDMIEAFVEYLQSRSTGEGAHATYKRFKKVIKYAVEHGVMSADPCKEVKITRGGGQLKKDILSPDEIRRLAATECTNKEIKRAFLFSLCTGVRWVDVKAMTYRAVDYSNQLLRFEQAKVEGHSAASLVSIPLTQEILTLIGTPSKDNPDGPIFTLPSYTAASQTLQRWMTKAGITKHITWHCARHSFAVNLLNNGANMKTTADLLGHSSTAITEVYVRAVDGLKRAAIESLPHINLQDDGE